MDNEEKLNYKWFWLLGVIGFLLGLLILIFGWKSIIIVILTILGAGVGILVDLYIIKKQEPPLPPDEE